MLIPSIYFSIGMGNIAQSSLDKKNRKKRAAKTSSPDQSMQKLVINSDVDAFYTKFMRDKYFTRADS